MPQNSVLRRIGITALRSTCVVLGIVVFTIVAARPSSADPLMLNSVVGGVGSFPIPVQFTDYTFQLMFAYSCGVGGSDCEITDWHADFAEDDLFIDDALGSDGGNFESGIPVPAGTSGTLPVSATIRAQRLSDANDGFEGSSLEIIGTAYLTWDSVPPTGTKQTRARAITPVPEPSTIVLFGTALGARLIRRRPHRLTF